MSDSTSEPWATAAPLPPPAPPAPPRPSWLRMVAAAAFLILLGLGQQVGCFAALAILPFSARLAAVAVVGPLLCLLLAMAIADAARVAPGLPSAIYGVDARSVKVWSTLGGVVMYVFVVTPILTWVTDKIGLTGTTSVELGHRSWWFVVATGIATVLVAPWLEEVAIRGLLLEGLWARIGFWPAAFASALIWSALHEVGGVLIVFTGLGVMLAWVRRRTGSVRMGIVLHTLQNTIATGVNGGVWIAIPLFVVQAAVMFLTRADAADGVTRWFRATVRRAMARARQLAEVPQRGRVGVSGVAMLLAAAYLIEVLARIAFAAGGAHAWRTAAAALLVVVGVALVTLAGTRGGLAGVDPAPAVAGAGLGVVLVLSSAVVVAGAGGARGFTALGLVGLGWWLLGAARLGPLGGYDRMGVLAGGGVLLSVVPLVDVTRDVAVTQVLVAAAVSAVAVLAWARGSAAIASVHR